MQNTIEKSKRFPIFAWTIIIGFTLLVYLLVIKLEAETDSLEANRIQTESAFEKDLRYEYIEY